MPRCLKISQSNFMFCAILRTLASSRSGFSRASTSASGNWPGRSSAPPKRSLPSSQFRAMLSPSKTVEIARAMVAKKVRTEEHDRSIEREFLGAVRKAKTTDDVRHVEAKAAQDWWQQWVG